MKILNHLATFSALSGFLLSATLSADACVIEEPTVDPDPSGACCEQACNSNRCGWYGIWLPEDPPLFRPPVADPRRITYSAGWRLNDEVLVKNVIDVSFGDTVPFYRWCNVGPWNGQLQLELEGAVWAIFDPLHNSSPLINADYYGGLTLSYASGPFALRLRAFHISCHIGDEFLLNHVRYDRDHPGNEHLEFDRRNPSAEYLDLFASYYPSDEIRLYSGLGLVVSQDESFKYGRFYAQAGIELHMSQLGFVNECQQLYGRPFYGMDFRFQTLQNKHINQTYVLGYEWGKLCGLQRVLRIFIEYHDGYSYEGQFAHFPTNYFSLRASYGF